MNSPLRGDSAAASARRRLTATTVSSLASGLSVSAPLSAQRDSSRLSGIDAARGIAMIMVCLSHIRYHFDAYPWVYSALTYISRAATPTFLLLSGFVAAYVLSTRGRKARIALIDRALCVLIVGHLLLNLEQLTQYGVREWLFARVTVTDAIAICLMVAALCSRLPAIALSLLGGTLALLSWPVALTTSVDTPIARYLAVALFDIQSEHSGLVDAAIVPYLGVFMVGMGLSKSWMRDIEHRRYSQLARRLFITGAGAIGAVVLAVLLWNALGDVIAASTTSPEFATIAHQTLDPRQKLPPSPGYLLFYGGAGLLIAATCLASRPRTLLGSIVSWTAIIGRASLMCFVVQDWLLRSVPVLFGFDRYLNPLFWIAYLVATVVILHSLATLWTAANANRFLTVGLKRLKRVDEQHAESPANVRKRLDSR